MYGAAGDPVVVYMETGLYIETANTIAAVTLVKALQAYLHALMRLPT
jgi:hypothetical protein